MSGYLKTNMVVRFIAASCMGVASLIGGIAIALVALAFADAGLSTTSATISQGTKTQSGDCSSRWSSAAMPVKCCCPRTWARCPSSAAAAGRGLTYLAKRFLPSLLEAGLDAATIRLMTIENPTRWLTIDRRAKFVNDDR